MFEYISGTIAAKGDTYAVVDAGGIGYRLTMTANSLIRLKTGEKTRVYTHLYISENIMELYGFASADEREMFRRLIGISGIGPKAAAAILSLYTPQSLAAAIVTEDEKAISKAPGIGKKTAGRIILELKDKLTDSELVPVTAAEQPQSDAASEALEALLSLGYMRSEALTALSGLGEELPTEEMIRQALKKMAR